METRKRSSNRQNQPKERIIPIILEDCNFEISPTTEELPPSGSKPGQQSPDSSDSLIWNTEEAMVNQTKEENRVKTEYSSLIGFDKEEAQFEPVTIPEKTLPSFNVPEKIIIVLDPALDDNSTFFEVAKGKTYSPLYMLKRTIEIYLHNKSFISRNHQFALVVLNENKAQWVHNFTSSIKDIIASIESVTECESEDIFNLTSLFELISTKVCPIPQVNDIHIPPTIIYRTIIIYGRSYCIPELQKSDIVSDLLLSPYFNVDVIMTHEPPGVENHCEKIFKVLQEVDPKGTGYAFNVARNVQTLHNAMANLLSHPLQRSRQIDANYTV